MFFRVTMDGIEPLPVSVAQFKDHVRAHKGGKKTMTSHHALHLHFFKAIMTRCFSSDECVLTFDTPNKLHLTPLNLKTFKWGAPSHSPVDVDKIIDIAPFISLKKENMVIKEVHLIAFKQQQLTTLITALYSSERKQAIYCWPREEHQSE